MVEDELMLSRGDVAGLLGGYECLEGDAFAAKYTGRGERSGAIVRHENVKQPSGISVTGNFAAAAVVRGLRGIEAPGGSIGDRNRMYQPLVGLWVVQETRFDGTWVSTSMISVSASARTCFHSTLPSLSSVTVICNSSSITSEL